MNQLHKGDRVIRVLKRPTTNEQRRQAAALVRSFPASEVKHEMTLQIGSSLFKITIDKAVTSP